MKIKITTIHFIKSFIVIKFNKEKIKQVKRFIVTFRLNKTNIILKNI